MDTDPIAALPDPVLHTCRRVVGSGHDAVLVGGAVRDVLRGVETQDWDLVTDATTDELRALLGEAPGVRSVYDVGERFGTIGVALEAGGRVEISRYRADALTAASLPERFATDAGHRDFTVNAIGLDIAAGTLLDPVEGQADLASGTLRAPGVAAERFAEDRVRVLRAARFVAELGFGLDAATAAALPDAAAGLATVAAERVRDELTKLLVAPFAVEGLRVLRDSRALDVVLPEVAALAGVAQPTFHDLDVLDHTVQTVGLVPRSPVLRWAALLHDVGKAPTRTVEPDGRIRFFRHAQVGAEMARAVAERLRFSSADMRAVEHLVAQHMRLGDVDYDNPRSVDRAVRKLDLRVEGPPDRTLVTAEDAVELTLADFGATAHRHEAPALRRALELAIAESRERGTQRAIVSPIGGEDIMGAFGLSEGPAVGTAKRAVEAAIEDGRLADDDVEGALRVAAEAVGLRAESGGAAEAPRIS